MAFAEKPIDNSPPLHFVSETPLGDKSDITLPHRTRLVPDSLEWFDAEYKKVKNSDQTRFRTLLGYAPKRIRDGFIHDHQDFRP